VALLNRSLYNLRLFLAGLGDSKEGILHLVLVEKPEEAPETGTTTILILAFGGIVTLIDPRRGDRKLAESHFRHAISLENTALRALRGELEKG
jgi:hypothetical protein